MNPLCHDCDESPATKPWDCGLEHERLIGVRTVDLCDECWTARADEQPVDDRDEAYERACARAESNDFEDTGGRDWR